MVDTISAFEFIQKISTANNGCFIDVRSPSEFQAGHLPQFKNLYLLNDDQRHHIGLCYKNSGRDSAIKLGLQLVPEESKVDEWKKNLPHSPRHLYISCLRGGLRSEISAKWLIKKGYRVTKIKGGYKSLRNELLKTLTSPPGLIVLTGFTGSGKTLLIQQMQGVDLEKLAHHRGSAFGNLGLQPPQSTFENYLSIALLNAKHFPILIEDEGHNIGEIVLPYQLRLKIKKSPIIQIDSPLEERVERILQDYVINKSELSPEVLESKYLLSLRHLYKKLGGLKFKEISNLIQDAFKSSNDLGKHRHWIRELLVHHYDKLYTHSVENSSRKVLFRGNFSACKHFLANYFNKKSS